MGEESLGKREGKVQRKDESQGSGTPPGRGKILGKMTSSKAWQGTMSTGGSQGAVVSMPHRNVEMEISLTLPEDEKNSDGT